MTLRRLRHLTPTERAIRIEVGRKNRLAINRAYGCEGECTRTPTYFKELNKKAYANRATSTQRKNILTRQRLARERLARQIQQRRMQPSTKLKTTPIKITPLRITPSPSSTLGRRAVFLPKPSSWFFGMSTVPKWVANPESTYKLPSNGSVEIYKNTDGRPWPWEKGTKFYVHPDGSILLKKIAGRGYRYYSKGFSSSGKSTSTVVKTPPTKFGL